MPRLRKGAIPSYRYHKARDCAVVTIDGHDHYLGPFGSPSSKQKYAALIRAWQQRQREDQQKQQAERQQPGQTADGKPRDPQQATKSRQEISCWRNSILPTVRRRRRFRDDVLL